jgi:hypothetical protein
MTVITPVDFEARNKAFKALSPEQQRIAVAVDAIGQIHLSKFVPVTGNYFELGLDSEVRAEDDLQKLMATEGAICEVCARGAVFASAVRLSDGVLVPAQCDGMRCVEFGACDTSFLRKEREIFTRGQLALMETAFELNYEHVHDCTNRDAIAAVKFGYQYEDSYDRLLAILQNVVESSGTFDPHLNIRLWSPKTFFKRYPIENK